MRHGLRGNLKFNHRPPRCISHCDKAAGKQILRSFKGDLKLARELGWLK